MAGSPRSWSYDYSPNGSLPETSATSHTIRTVIAAAKRYSLAVMGSAARTGIGRKDSGLAGNEGSRRARKKYVTPSTSLRTQIENGATTDFCTSMLFGSEPNDCDLVGRGWHSLQREHRGQRLLFDSSRWEDRHLVRADRKTHKFVLW